MMFRLLNAVTPGEPLPPGGREPPEAHKLALLRELSTFITWRVLLIAWNCLRFTALLRRLMVCAAASRSRHENLVQLFGWCGALRGMPPAGGPPSADCACALLCSFRARLI